jgi:hypothetical protein
MKAILIDSKNKTVTEVKISNSNTLVDWYKAIECNCVEIAMQVNIKNDKLLVDENGLLKELKLDTPFFFYGGSLQPFVGNGLIVGVDDEGDSISCHISAAEVSENVVFTTYEKISNSII